MASEITVDDMVEKCEFYRRQGHDRHDAIRLTVDDTLSAIGQA